MEKSHLLIYSDSHVLGGADRYLLGIIPTLLHDWKITYVYRKDVDFKLLTNEFEKLGVECLKLTQPNFNWSSYLELRKLFDKQKPDLIVFNQGSFYTSKVARLTAKLMKLPQVIIQHGSTYEGEKFYSIANRLFARFTFPDALAIIVPSKSSEKFFQERFSYLHQVKIINHGIDLAKFNPDEYSRINIRKKLNIPSDVPTLIFVGRLELDKNADHLIELHQKIDLPNLHMIILGEGSLEKELKQEAQTKTLDNIHFLGKTDGTAEYLSVSDALAQTSRSESFSLAVVEAMATGVVPVAFKVDSLPAMIGEESLIADYPDFDQMARIIKELLQNKAKRRELSVKVQARARKLFDDKRMQEQTRKIFQEINNKISKQND